MSNLFGRAERDRAPALLQVAILNVINRDPDRAYGSAITDEVSRWSTGSLQTLKST